MMTVKDVETRATTLGVELIVCRGDYGRIEEVELLAPRGKHFVANGCHSYVLSREGWGDDEAPLADLWRGVAEVLDYGLEPCSPATPCDDWREGGCDMLREARRRRR